MELHGTLMSAHCPACHTGHALDYINQHDVPLCGVCGDFLKPDVVLYGEAVPHIEKAIARAAEVDCLLVMGSSLEVSPVNYIPMVSAENGIPTALINLSSTRMDDLFTHVIYAGIGATCTTLRQVMAP
jgi:NAD-dependent SIR2 family protein deacetylase